MYDMLFLLTFHANILAISCPIYLSRALLDDLAMDILAITLAVIVQLFEAKSNVPSC